MLGICERKSNEKEIMKKLSVGVKIAFLIMLVWGCATIPAVFQPEPKITFWGWRYEGPLNPEDILMYKYEAVALQQLSETDFIIYFYDPGYDRIFYAVYALIPKNRDTYLIGYGYWEGNEMKVFIRDAENHIYKQIENKMSPIDQAESKVFFLEMLDRWHEYKEFLKNKTGT